MHYGFVTDDPAAFAELYFLNACKCLQAICFLEDL